MARNDFPQPSSITEFDLQAYMDGQLDDARRIEVEDYLSRHPEAAADLMAALRTTDALRLFAQSQDAPSGRLLEDAVRLQQGLKRQSWRRHALRLTGLAAAITVGWIVVSAIQPFGSANQRSEAATLAFVDDALDAQRALNLRQRMVSQIEAVNYDPVELWTETRLSLPELPSTWTVRDVQVYPWDEGYSIGVTADAGSLGVVTLFVAPRPSDLTSEFHVTTVGEGTAAFWQSGDLAYALVGKAPEADLQAAATQLLASLNDMAAGRSAAAHPPAH